MSDEREQRAIPAGMVAWHGGDSAPVDWDGGPVYTYDDSAEPGDQYELAPFHFGEGAECWQHNNPYVDIIAYTPAATLPPQAPAADRSGETGEGLAYWQGYDAGERAALATPKPADAGAMRERCARLADILADDAAGRAAKCSSSAGETMAAITHVVVEREARGLAAAIRDLPDAGEPL
ncbi:hypothetical protein M9979_12250 [Sphingomonas sp. RP10(2022)]|uniref:Uncharacterized protein n=1 Tax=Sphingomonas liriopis TaxID=2949094 RepID=A0A9X2I0M0_9SPHN|nr:hypothetical protein [Sphingomonas liriopis]MCP3735645.1 hypothetical protein [Sphingomonas liriopis]